MARTSDRQRRQGPWRERSGPPSVLAGLAALGPVAPVLVLLLAIPGGGDPQAAPAPARVPGEPPAGITDLEIAPELLGDLAADASGLPLRDVAAAGTAPGAPAAGLGPDSLAVGYREWLHSVELTAAALRKDGLEEDHELYPFGKRRARMTSGSPVRYLAVARALGSLEKGGAGQRATALAALSMWRNYANLAEYDSALAWYGVAAALDTAEQHAGTIGRERLATAVAARDSAETLRALVNAIGRSSVRDRQPALTLAYRFLLCGDDTTRLDLVTAKVAAEEAALEPGLRCWHALALERLGRPAAARRQIVGLVALGGASGGLDLQERALALAALPRVLAAEGRREASAAHYRLIADSSLPGLAIEGTLGLAGLDFAAARYDSAGVRYGLLAVRPELQPWQEHFSEMARLSGLLADIMREGEPYGLDARFRR